MSDYETEYQARMKWLAELKPGDEVFVQPHFDSAYPAKVVRTTKTQIIVQKQNLVGSSYESKYRKDGTAVGASMLSSRLIQPTDEVHEKYENSRLTSQVKRLWENIVLPKDSGQLKEIAAVLQRYQKPQITKKE